MTTSDFIKNRNAQIQIEALDVKFLKWYVRSHCSLSEVKNRKQGQIIKLEILSILFFGRPKNWALEPAYPILYRLYMPYHMSIKGICFLNYQANYQNYQSFISVAEWVIQSFGRIKHFISLIRFISTLIFLLS